MDGWASVIGWLDYCNSMVHCCCSGISSDFRSICSSRQRSWPVAKQLCNRVDATVVLCLTKTIATISRDRDLKRWNIRVCLHPTMEWTIVLDMTPWYTNRVLLEICILNEWMNEWMTKTYNARGCRTSRIWGAGSRRAGQRWLYAAGGLRCEMSF